jgi:hypothetical protein
MQNIPFCMGSMQSIPFSKDPEKVAAHGWAKRTVRPREVPPPAALRLQQWLTEHRVDLGHKVIKTFAMSGAA